MSTCEELATEVRRRFPELQGRAFAVSEIEPLRAPSVPLTLPLAAVALLRIVNVGDPDDHLSLQELFVVEFMFQTAAYQTQEGRATMFVSFYDYEDIVERMGNLCMEWITPRRSRLKFQRMNIEALPRFVCMSFTLAHNWRWCPGEETPPRLRPRLRMVSCKIPCEPGCHHEPDPCDAIAARAQ